MATSLNSIDQARADRRWRFLEGRMGACGVISERMELLYLNPAARALVPARWFGCRCWQAFPVANPGCASHCPVLRAVAEGSEISFFEETVFPPGQAPVSLGVAVIPLPASDGDDGRALLLLRPRKAGEARECARQELLAEAGRVRVLCREQLGAGG
jgi:hypothetical protein